MDFYAIINIKTNTIQGVFKSKEDAINAFNNHYCYIEEVIGNFIIIKQSIDLKDIKNEEDFDSFICIKGYTTEILINSNDSYPNVEYTNMTYNLEIDKDFKVGVPKFTKFEASAKFESDDRLNIQTHFTIWIGNKTAKLSWNLKGFVDEIIKNEYSKLDKIKDFKQAFKKMMQVKCNITYSDII